MFINCSLSSVCLGWHWAGSVQLFIIVALFENLHFATGYMWYNEAKHKIWEGGKQNNPMNNTKMVMCPNVNLKMLIITSFICTGYVIVTL